MSETKKIIFSILILFVIILKTQAQEEKYQELQFLLEQVVEQNEDANIQQMIEELYQLVEKPLSINSIQKTELEKLFFLSPMQQEALLNYRTKYGKILSPYELQLIEGFDQNTAMLCSLFFSFEAKNDIPIKYKTRHKLQFRTDQQIENQDGYKNGNFEGNKTRLYLQYKLSSNNFDVGFTGEKDPGEAFFAGSNSKGFDYTSGFVSYTLNNNKSKIIFGDYVVQWGQGLSIWQGFSTGKTSDTDQIARIAEEIKPYSSTNENNFMRGISAQIRTNNLCVMPFISFNKSDGNINNIDGNKVFTSLQTSGLHRTESEINNEKSIKTFASGIKINYQKETFIVGVSATYVNFNLPMQRSKQLYNENLFSGQNNISTSLTYRYSYNKLFLFGELSNANNAWATINGLMFQPVGQLAFSMLYRGIGENYNSIYASSFTENSRVNDEQGVYLGMKLSPISKISLNAYVDIFNSKWIKYTTSSPSKGTECVLQISYNVNKNFIINSSFFSEIKPQKVTTDIFDYDLERKRKKMKVQVDSKLTNSWSLRTRFDMVSYEHRSADNGFYLGQDFIYKMNNDKFKAWLRVAYFNTTDYNSRVTVYENDLLYQFSMPSFSGKGVRSYINLAYKLNNTINMRLKFGKTYYSGIEEMGSGNSRVDGNARGEIKYQIIVNI